MGGSLTSRRVMQQGRRCWRVGCAVAGVRFGSLFAGFRSSSLLSIRGELQQLVYVLIQRNPQEITHGRNLAHSTRSEDD